MQNTLLTPQQFVAKWTYARRRALGGAEHFIDLYRLLIHPGGADPPASLSASRPEQQNTAAARVGPACGSAALRLGI